MARRALDPGNLRVRGRVRLFVSYRVPLLAPVGARLDSGLTFEASGFVGPQGNEALGMPLEIGSLGPSVLGLLAGASSAS